MANPERYARFEGIYVPKDRLNNDKSNWPLNADYIFAAPDELIYGDGVISSESLEKDLQAYSFVYGGNVRYVDLSGATLDEDVTAETLKAAAGNGTLFYLPSGSSITGDNIVVDGVASRLVLTDGEAVEIPKAFTATSVSYNRSIAQGEANAATLCLPYDYALPESLTAYTLKRADSAGNLVFAEVESGQLEANKPYVVVASQAVGNLDADNVTVQITNTDDEGIDGYAFYGTLSGLSSGEAATEGAYVLAAGNVWKAAGDEGVMPGRAYLVPSDDKSQISSILGGADYADGDVFTAQTVEGVTMTFKVLSADGRTCQVGDGANTCIDKNTTGSVTIPATVKGYRVTTIASWALYRTSAMTELTIPEGVERLETNSIESCDGLTSIVIPASVTSISNTFGGFGRELKSIRVAEGNPVYDSRENCNAVIETATNTLRAGCGAMTIPSSVTTIGEWSLYGKYLTSIEIPEHVTTIENNALGHNYFTEVTIPASVVSIQSLAFENCERLKEVTILSKECTVANFAFGNNKVLEKFISYIEHPVATTRNIFYSVRDFSTNEYKVNDDVTLYVPKGAKSLYEATAGWNNFPNIVEMAAEEETIKIGAAGKVPYYSDKNLDFTDVSSLKAYTVTGYDKDEGTIWLSRVYKVPAETGILVVGNEGSYDVPVSENSDSYYKNMLVGNVDATTVYPTDGEYTNYCQVSGVFRAAGSGGITLGKNRAYLQIPTDILTSGSSSSLENITIGAVGRLPYYSANSLDFTNVEGLKAYTVTGYDKSGTIWLSRVYKVPARTGVLLIGNAGNYSIPTTTAATYYVNMLVGNIDATTVYTTDGDYTNFCQVNGIFRAVGEGGISLNKNRAYLQIPTSILSSKTRNTTSESDSFNNMVFGDDVISIKIGGAVDPTGIEEHLESVSDTDVYYNLNGQQVKNPSKGLYIKNGKKVIIR